MAQAILDRTNKMNIDIGIQAVLTTLVLAAIPELLQKLNVY